jgi:putative transposase
VGVCLRGPLPRRGLGPCGQGRRPLRRPPAGLRRRHRPLGRLEADVARGLALRHDWGPQYRSAHFTGSLAWLGISDDPAFLGEPETNGCAERWIRTLKEQCLWVQLHDTVEELGQAVAGFVERYNSSWLIQRHSHQTPKEAYQAAQAAAAA